MKITASRKGILFSLAISYAGMNLATASTLIYEPFAGAPGALDTQAGGLGLGTWSGPGGGLVQAGSTTFGSLPTTGNKYIGDPDTGGAGYTESWASIGTSLSSAGVLDHGAELWFSVVIQPGSGSNDYGFIGLSSAQGNIGANYTSVPTGANMVGIWLQNGSDLDMVHAINGVAHSTNPRNRVQNNLSLSNPTLVVGKFTWGANGAANDLFEIYLPGAGLALPGSPNDSSTFVIDQSTFSELAVWMRNANSQVDEIRFGESYADVIDTIRATPIPEPSSSILVGVGFAGLLGLRRRR